MSKHGMVSHELCAATNSAVKVMTVLFSSPDNESEGSKEKNAPQKDQEMDNSYSCFGSILPMRS
jgi:hypothetical protein